MEFFMFDIHEVAIRLVEERARLGLSQNTVAEKTGKSRVQYINYEMGRSEMTIGVLCQIAELGFDVQYIITGIHSLNSVAKQENDVDAKTVNNIQGNVSSSIFAGSGSTIHQINTEQHITRTKAEVKPGIEHITDEQKATLQRLVNEIVELESKYRTEKSAKKHQAVWKSLNSKLKVTSYHLIPLDKYETARKHLQSWIGRLSDTKTAKKTDVDNVRKRKYAYIHTNINKLGLDEWYKEHLKQRYNVESSKELDDTQLQQLYQAVAYKVRMANKG